MFMNHKGTKDTKQARKSSFGASAAGKIVHRPRFANLFIALLIGQGFISAGKPCSSSSCLFALVV